MIKFSLPDYYSHAPIIFYFLTLQKEHPEYFIPNRVIDSVYGFPANLIWNGGRVQLDFAFDPSDNYKLIKDYFKHDIHIRHTCTNMLLDERHFNDFLCNYWLTFCERPKDAIILYSDSFAEYIKQTYPKYDIIYSTTRNDDLDTVNKLSETNLVVLNYNYNQNKEYLQQLQHPENIEVVCAEACIPNCPNRQQHYLSISKHQMFLPLDNTDIVSCPFSREHGFNFYDILDFPHAITTEYVDVLYNQYGIQNFKISGRKNNPVAYIEPIIYYLIKPEYQDQIRQHALTLTL